MRGRKLEPEATPETSQMSPEVKGQGQLVKPWWRLEVFPAGGCAGRTAFCGKDIVVELCDSLVCFRTTMELWGQLGGCGGQRGGCGGQPGRYVRTWTPLLSE